MSNLAPKIDQRTHQDLVQQTQVQLTHQDLLVFWWKWYLKIQVDRPLKAEDLDLWFISLTYHLMYGRATHHAGAAVADSIAHSPAGQALIRIFSRMAGQVSDRLNQAPDRNFLAFLDLLGGQLKPPQPARVPLTFILVAGRQANALVPAHVQVASPAQEGETEDVIFETEQELVVTPAQLKTVCVRDPKRYRICDLKDITTSAPLFSLSSSGEDDVAIQNEHALYVTLDQIFALPAQALKNVQLTCVTESSVQRDVVRNALIWTDGPGGNILTLNNDPGIPADTEAVFTFRNLSTLQWSILDGRTAPWLRAELNPEIDIDDFPKLAKLTGHISVELEDQKPVACLFNETPIDLSKPFYPFGEKPQINDTFYIALHSEFINPGTTVTITIAHATEAILNAASSSLAWEISHETQWISLKSPSEPEATNNPEEFTFELPAPLPTPKADDEIPYWIRVRIISNDKAYRSAPAPTQHHFFEEITLLSSPTTSEADKTKLSVAVADGFQQNDVIRVQSTRGQFYIEEAAVTEPPDTAQKKLTLNRNLANTYQAGDRVLRRRTINETLPPTYNPPIITDIKLDYKFEIEELANCVAVNDFHLSRPSVSEQDYDPKFQPFIPTPDQQPCLYLGFDRPFGNQTVTLYAQVDPPLPGSLPSQIPADRSEPTLVWEYRSSQPPNPASDDHSGSWQPLYVQDETQAFTQPGLIQFIGPADFGAAAEFGQELYWLRVRWVDGNFLVPPRLRQILTNTTWAVQALTLTQELLGSSNGSKHQTFTTSHTPVLGGQKLQVQEGLTLPAEERTRLSKQDPNSVEIILDEARQPEAVWVHWQEVPDFYASAPGDRHYTLDRQSGTIQFGDELQGRIPPAGANNIRITYPTGGGRRGNRPPNTVNQLNTTLPYIDTVTNLEPARGGAEQETLEQLKTRVPKQLRHGNRAVTWQDFGDLAYEASTQVKRVKVIPPDLSYSTFTTFNPSDPDQWIDVKASDTNQWVKVADDINPNAQHTAVAGGTLTVIVVPDTADIQPTPSIALLNQVQVYLQERCAPTVKLLVTGPQWQQVTVGADIAPVALAGADRVRVAVRQRLTEFLHPLTGGEGQGWAFGRYPHRSDLYGLIQSVPGVDYVESLTVWFSSGGGNSPQIQDDEAAPRLQADTLIYSGLHQIELSQPGRS